MNGCKVKEDVTGSWYTVNGNAGGDKIVTMVVGTRGQDSLFTRWYDLDK